MPDPLDRPIDALLPGRPGLFVRIEARQGARAGLLDAMHRYMDDLGEEPGTEAYLLCLDPDDASVVWVYEWFTDEAAVQAHRESGAFARMMNEIPPLLAREPGILRIDPLRLYLRTSVVAASDSL